MQLRSVVSERKFAMLTFADLELKTIIRETEQQRRFQGRYDKTLCESMDIHHLWHLSLFGFRFTSYLSYFFSVMGIIYLKPATVKKKKSIPGDSDIRRLGDSEKKWFQGR